MWESMAILAIKQFIYNRIKRKMFKKLKAKLAAKAVAATSSATMGVVGVFLLGATWVQTHPELVIAAVGSGWGGIVVALAAVVVAVARFRTLASK